MKLYLKIWRQKNSESKGKIIDYDIENISPDMSFLEMLDVLNADLISKDEDPVSFDHDCREGICGLNFSRGGRRYHGDRCVPQVSFGN